MSCHKCGKLGHFASQCIVEQGFQTGQFQKRPPQIKTLQLEEQENEYTEYQEMTQDEIRERENYENTAESQIYLEAYSTYSEEETENNIDY